MVSLDQLGTGRTDFDASVHRLERPSNFETFVSLVSWLRLRLLMAASVVETVTDSLRSRQILRQKQKVVKTIN